MSHPYAHLGAVGHPCTCTFQLSPASGPFGSPVTWNPPVSKLLHKLMHKWVWNTAGPPDKFYLWAWLKFHGEGCSAWAGHRKLYWNNQNLGAIPCDWGFAKKAQICGSPVSAISLGNISAHWVQWDKTTRSLLTQIYTSSMPCFTNRVTLVVKSWQICCQMSHCDFG